jgi:hypothetical protein
MADNRRRCAFFNWPPAFVGLTPMWLLKLANRLARAQCLT